MTDEKKSGGGIMFVIRLKKESIESKMVTCDWVDVNIE